MKVRSIMITVSVCMIVKDEEQVLARCLNSLAGLYDELIIVDTGSSDATLSIAHTYTDKVYSYQWTNDFAAARNYSMQYATKEYIYCADADEVIDSENHKRFQNLKAALSDNVEIVQMLYINQLQYNTVYNFDSELRPKLYRRSSNFIFEGPVHEKVNVPENCNVFSSDICIKHCPQNLHRDRDFSIFLKKYSRGEYLTPHLLTQYSKELFICGNSDDFLAASPIYENQLSNESLTTESILEICCVLLNVAFLQGNLPKFLKYSLKGCACNGCSELYYIIGLNYYKSEDYDEAIVWFYNAAFEASSVLNVKYCTTLPLHALADSYEKLNMFDIAKEYRTRALEESIHKD